MAILDNLISISDSERFAELEKRDSGVAIKGDFEGSVTGHWVKLGQNGEGVVSYNNKEYKTKPIGFTSIPKGTEVELGHANGMYYSKF